MREKIKVLFLAADPFREGARRQLDEEMRAIEQAVKQGTARDGLALAAHFATRTRDVQAALLGHRPQIVHFAGQGDAPGVIYLADEHGHPHPAGREALRGLFGGLGGSVRVLVLNGCDSLGTVEPLSEVVDYTVAMNAPAGGRPAIIFADAFYSALAMGRTVLTAFELGLSQLAIEGDPDVATPVRRIRRGVNLDATLVPIPDAGAGGVHGPQAGPLRRRTLPIFKIEREPGVSNGSTRRSAERRSRIGRVTPDSGKKH